MARPLDAVLDHVSCRTLLWILGALTGLSALKTGLAAGSAGVWGWWLLLALLFGALWGYTWFYCGREAITGERELARSTLGGSSGSATASASPEATGNISTESGAKQDGPKTPHWSRSKGAVSGGGGSGAASSDEQTSEDDAVADKAGAGEEAAVTSTEPVTATSSSETVADVSGATASDEDAAVSDEGVTADTSGSQKAVATETELPSGEKPSVLDGPRDGEGDDLKQISGVGPKLEGLLHSLGFYHFDQIAAWTPENVAWVDDHLGFKGRIERDDWIGQAKKLAGGEMTEFAGRVARGEVDSSKSG